MKVALINSVAGFGSTGRLVEQLSKMEGVTGRIYYGRKHDITAGADTFKMNGFFGNADHAVRTYFSDSQCFCNARETERMVADLKSFQPDLIHLHNLHGYYLNAEVLFRYLKESGKPVLWTLHDCWAFTGHCVHYEGMDCSQWKTECRKCPELNHYPFTCNGSHVTENFHRKQELFTSIPDQLTLVTPSQWLLDQVHQSFLKDQKSLVISNGIDPSRFQPTESSFRRDYHLEGKTVVLAVASMWTQAKGLDQLARLSRDLPEEYSLVLTGTMFPWQKKNFSPRTVMIPHTESVQELCGIYTAADALINLTQEDTFPTVNLEAMACGTPVLTYRTGGSPEMLAPHTGSVIERNDYPAMRQAILSLRTGTDFNAEDCKKQASRYTLSAMYDRYLKLYRQAAGEENAG